MARLHPAIDQGGRDRKRDAGLADVVGGVGEQLGAAVLELGPAGARPDGDAVAARLAHGLDDELVEMVERVSQRLRLAADMGLDVRQDRLLVQVVADHARHVGIDRLVVGDAGADRVGQRDVARAIGTHQAGHAELAVGQEGLGIEVVVVDAAVDHVDRREAARGAHPDPVVLAPRGRGPRRAARRSRGRGRRARNRRNCRCRGRAGRCADRRAAGAPTSRSARGELEPVILDRAGGRSRRSRSGKARSIMWRFSTT